MGNFFYRANIAQPPFFGIYYYEKPSLRTFSELFKGKKGLNFKSVLFYAVDIVRLILSPSFKMQLQQKRLLLKVLNYSLIKACN